MARLSPAILLSALLSAPAFAQTPHVAEIATFGPALGDGSSADAAISAALASRESPTVHFPAGVFGLTSLGPHRAASAVSLVGEGLGRSIIRFPANCDIATFLFTWPASTAGITVRDLTFDLNGCSASALSAVLGFGQGQSQIRIDRVGIVGAASAGRFMFIAINGAHDGWITDSTISARAASTAQNQAVLISTYSGPDDRWHILGNRFERAGLLLDGTNNLVQGNDIGGWAYGAGIGTEIGKREGASSADAVITGNRIHDSATSADADGYANNGIEHWGIRGIVAHNDISNVGGLCISSGGRDSVISGNVCVGPGKHVDARGMPAPAYGIVTQAAPGASGAGSVYTGNIVADDGTGTTLGGYFDAVPKSHALLDGNRFTGSRMLASGIANPYASGNPNGSSSFEPSADNRVQNPCFAIDQRHGGRVVERPGNGAFATDRWRAFSSASTFSYQQTSTVISRCRSSEAITVAAPSPPDAAGYAYLRQMIPAGDLVDVEYGGAAARAMRLEFCARAPYSGRFAGAVQNPNSGRSYVFAYQLAANAAGCFSVPIDPDDAGGFLAAAPGAPGLSVVFDLGSGERSAAPVIGRWIAGNYSTARDLLGDRFGDHAAGATLYLSAVRLSVGTRETGWIPRPHAAEMALLERFYRSSFVLGTTPSDKTGLAGSIGLTAPPMPSRVSVPVQFPRMIAVPAITLYSPGGSHATCLDITTGRDAGPATASDVGDSGFRLGCEASLGEAAGRELAVHYTADADGN